MTIQYNFHGVGQGLFCSGSAGDFQWVYDCGSFNKKKLSTAINQFSGRINLLAISHFHEDHINGIPELKKKGIDAVLLPFLTKGMRALVLIDLISSGNNVSADCLRLLHSPPKYFEKSRIIYVVPFQSNLPGKAELVLKDLRERNDIPTQSDDPWEAGNNIHKLSSGGKLDCNEFFFVPFYDASRFQSEEELASRCGSLKEIEAFFANRDIDSSLWEIEKIINEMKQQRKGDVPYAERYSMCLLGTPAVSQGGMNTEGICQCIKRCEACPNYRQCSLCGSKTCVLYTGDAPLKAQYRVKNFTDHYKEYLKKIFCFQVMHHGSKYNFSKGFAAQISPCFSIFSANPTFKYHHPHKGTINEFMDYHPIFVNDHSFFCSLQSAN